MKLWKWSFIAVLFFFPLYFPTVSTYSLAETVSGSAISIQAKSAVLLEGNSGEILYEKKKDKELVPASITKIMTLLLIWEAIDQGKLSLKDSVSVSEYAASMGGSQVFLEPNETQTVDTMIKCISIASANDAAVAMAEKIAGSEQSFVKKMNEKAKELGMRHTHFRNCTGLDDDIESGHYSSAYDVALMSRELIMKHPQISNYSTVWMDSIIHKTKKGDSTFNLTNTNKLVRFYKGITGLKTGSTSKAKYCLSATAKRKGTNLIAVVMAAPDHKIRFYEAQALLDYGFANCSLYEDDYHDITFPSLTVRKGMPSQITIYPKRKFTHTFTVEYDAKKIQKKITTATLSAPVKSGQEVGKLIYYYNKKEIGYVPLLACEKAKKAGYTDLLLIAFQKLFMITSA